MRRHPTDLVGLIFGTAFAIAGVAFLVNELTDQDVNFAWAAGVGLMLLGAVALIATLVRGPRDHDDHRHEHEYEPAYAFAQTPASPTLAGEEAPTAEATTTED